MPHLIFVWAEDGKRVHHTQRTYGSAGAIIGEEERGSMEQLGISPHVEHPAKHVKGS